MSVFFSCVGTLKKPFVALIDGITMGGVRVEVRHEREKIEECGGVNEGEDGSKYRCRV